MDTTLTTIALALALATAFTVAPTTAATDDPAPKSEDTERCVYIYPSEPSIGVDPNCIPPLPPVPPVP